MAERKAYLHKGHRARVKKQILDTGLKAMNDHQVVEALLFFSIPQGDTNEIAHDLVNECGGTLEGVINTRYDKLITLKGIGEHTAHLINFIRLVSKRYLCSSYIKEEAESLDSSSTQCELFKRMFLGSKNEEVYAAAFNDDFELICVKKIGEGGFSSVNITPRRLLDFAAENHSSRIVIAHNHPLGNCLPSRDDIELTAQFYDHLLAMEVELADHIVVGKEGAYSMRSSIYAGTIWNK